MVEPTLVINTLNQQAAALQWSNPTTARLLAEEALALAESDENLEAANHRSIGDSLTILSRCCLQQADYSATINYGLQAVAVSKSLATAPFLPQVLGQIGHA